MEPVYYAEPKSTSFSVAKILGLDFWFIALEFFEKYGLNAFLHGPLVDYNSMNSKFRVEWWWDG